MNILGGVILAAGLVIATGVQADEGEALARKYNCMMCHDVARQSTAPSYKDIAAKYKADKNAQMQLETKVRVGGSGVWGKVPMPPTSKLVADSDIRAIVQWILSVK